MRSVVAACCLLTLSGSIATLAFLMQPNVAAPAAAVLETARYGQLPLGFEVNRGQFDEPVRYVAQGQGYTLFLTPDEAVLSLQKPAAASGERDTIHAHLLAASKQPEILAEDLQPGRSNYLHGNDPARWVRNVEHYGRVRYRGVYPGVDLVYYGNQGRLEYDFVVAPESDPGQIRMHYTGVDGARVVNGGDLELQVSGNRLHLRKPAIYQDIDGRRSAVPGGYRFDRNGDGVDVSFSLGRYDRRHSLVIDPVLIYSTYLGGSANEFTAGASAGVAVDAAGQAYVVGTTLSTNFPQATLRSPTQGTEAYVAKFSADGRSLLYSTYLGGSGSDQGFAIALNAAGEAYVTGATTSVDFPMQDALFPARSGDPDPEVAAQDAFVSRLSADGRSLLYSTYLGGSDDDDPQNFGAETGYAVALDSVGQIYVAGSTTSVRPPSNDPDDPRVSVLFPTTSAVVRPNPGSATAGDGFASKFSADGQALIYSTFIGGSGNEFAYAIAVDATQQLTVAGLTTSIDFPTLLPLQSANGGGTDGFVAGLSADGRSFRYSTYLGGSGLDTAFGIAVSSAGQIYVTGNTASANFPLQSALDSSLGGTDAFISVLAPDGRSLQTSSFLGGAGSDFGRGVALDGDGHIYLTGYTSSTDFPVAAPFQAALAGSSDAFITELAADASSVIFSSYLGGSSIERSFGIAVDGNAQAYVTGITQSLNFRTEATFPAFQGSSGGGFDAFVARIGTPAVVAPGQISLGADRYSVSESDGSLAIPVHRSGGSNGAVSVSYSTANGTAQAGSDYLAQTGTLDWADGDASDRLITLQIVNDSEFEPNEDFNLTLDAATGGATLGTPAAATVTIIEDDLAQPGVLQFGAASYSVSEDGGSLLVTVTRTTGGNGAVSVGYATSGGNATAGTDYSAASGTLNWADGDVAAKSFSVSIANDAIVEGNETFGIALSAPTGGAVLGTPATVTATIVDDEVAQPGSLQFSTATYAVGEGGGSLVVSVNRVIGSDGAVSVRYTTGGGTATAGTDYEAAGGTLNWADGDQAAKTFSVRITNDSIVEGDETFGLALSAPTGGAALGSPATATATIVDDEVRQSGTLQFSAATYIVAENSGSLQVSVTRAGGGDGAVSVQYATGGGTATAGVDYEAASGVLNWTDGDTAAKTFTVTIDNDTLVEGNETFGLTLGGATGGAVLANPSTATAMIVDDEIARNGSVQFSAASYEVGEGGGSVTITATRTDGSDGAVSIGYATRNGTATAGADYTAQSGTLSWASGDSAPKTFQVPILEDSVVEGRENFSVTLSGPTGNAVLGAPATATVTVLDDEFNRGELRLSAAEYSVSEGGGSVTVTVMRLNGSDGAVSINYATADGTAIAPADYAARTGTLNWADGDAAPKNFVVPIIDDADFEGPEAFTVRLSAPGGGATLTAPDTATVTIQDNEVRPGTLQFEAPTYRVVENTGVVRVNVTRVGGTDNAVTVNYTTSQGTATSGSDYNAASGVLRWDIGDATPRTLTIQILDDGSFEGDETFSLVLSGPTGGAALGGPATAMITIADDEVTFAGGVRLGASSYEAGEASGSVAVTVLRGGSSDGAVSVAYSTINGTAASGSDYIAASGRVNWAAGDLEPKTIVVQILPDASVEGSENFSVVLSSPTGGVALDTPSTATVVINDATSASGDGSGKGGGAVDPYFLMLLLGVALRRAGIFSSRRVRLRLR